MNENKKYGGTTLFLGIVTLLSFGLVIYNKYYMIPIFKENGQTYTALAGNASVFEKFAYKYVSFFAQYFGKYPSTKVLAVAIPVTTVLIVATLIYFFKYLDQKKREKTAILEASFAERAEIQKDITAGEQQDEDNIPERIPEDTEEPASENNTTEE